VTVETPFRGVGDVLDCLNPHGIYNVAIIEEEMGRFGFAYDPATDQMTYQGGGVRLHAQYPIEMLREFRSGGAGGVLDEDLPTNRRLVDAIALSAAIHRLLFPGQMVPSHGHYGRAEGFRADLAAILASEQPLN